MLEDIAKAGAEVRKAAAARFGEEGTKKIDALEPFSAKELKGFVEKLDGDTALVYLDDPEENEPFALKKIEKVWKLDMAEVIKTEELSPANISKLSTLATKRLNKLKERVGKGETISAQAVAEEMRAAALGEGLAKESEQGW